MSLAAGRIERAGQWQGAAIGRIELDYDARFLRRKRLSLGDGRAVMVDLAETVSLDPGDALMTEAGPVEVSAAPEPLMKITGDLPRLAWHIGNRHTPCAVADDHLLIRADHVLEHMLKGLGAGVEPLTAPFTPEGGAYGMGRTHSHSHGPDHGHDHSHDH